MSSVKRSNLVRVLLSFAVATLVACGSDFASEATSSQGQDQLRNDIVAIQLLDDLEEAEAIRAFATRQGVSVHFITPRRVAHSTIADDPSFTDIKKTDPNGIDMKPGTFERGAVEMLKQLQGRGPAEGFRVRMLLLSGHSKGDSYWWYNPVGGSGPTITRKTLVDLQEHTGMFNDVRIAMFLSCNVVQPGHWYTVKSVDKSQNEVVSKGWNSVVPNHFVASGYALRAPWATAPDIKKAAPALWQAAAEFEPLGGFSPRSPEAVALREVIKQRLVSLPITNSGFMVQDEFATTVAQELNAIENYWKRRAAFDCYRYVQSPECADAPADVKDGAGRKMMVAINSLLNWVTEKLRRGEQDLAGFTVPGLTQELASATILTFYARYKHVYFAPRAANGYLEEFKALLRLRETADLATLDSLPEGSRGIPASLVMRDGEFVQQPEAATRADLVVLKDQLAILARRLDPSNPTDRLLIAYYHRFNDYLVNLVGESDYVELVEDLDYPSLGSDFDLPRFAAPVSFID